MLQAIFDWFSFAGEEVALFIVSMIPLIELRGSVILGAALGMPWQKVFIICVLGNLLPVPFSPQHSLRISPFFPLPSQRFPQSVWYV